MGPQGSGKGTQAKLLSRFLKIPHIDVGELFRTEAQKGTELGLKAKAYWDKGKLVPDETTIAMVNNRLAQKDCEKGFIIDGYPRTLEQAKALDKVAKPDFVIELKIPDQISIKRLSARRYCPKCGKIYSLLERRIKYCANCKLKLIRRADDRPKIIKTRLKFYHDQTEPILDYYKPRGIVYEVDGTKKIEEVFNAVVSVLKL